MKITARIDNSLGSNAVSVSTDGNSRSLEIPSKHTGYGSAVNGGELLFLALATCYCNDIYREAEKRGIEITSVAVRVQGEFGSAGEIARNVRYDAKVSSTSDEESIRDLLRHTDTVAEIQNTLRHGVSIALELHQPSEN
jgi:uncharacterized OsmC-like protein